VAAPALLPLPPDRGGRVSVVGAAKDAAGKATSSRPVRTWQHYGERRGNVLAAGIAYFAVFSLFPALAIGFTVFALVLGGNAELQDRLVATLNDTLPGLIGPDGLLSVEDLQRTDVLSVTGAVGGLLLLYTGLGWLDAMRQGVRAMFDQPAFDDNILLKKARDLGVLASLGLAVLASVLASVVVNAAAGWLLGLVGLSSGPVAQVLLTVLGVSVVLAVDVLIFLLLFRVLSGLRLPWQHLRQGALVGAVGLGLLKLLGGQLLGSAGGNNPVIAAAGVVGGLLVWLNLVARLTLLAASWAATDAVDAGSHRFSGPPAPDHPVPLGPRDLMAPSFGPRSADRTAVLAGVVLGGLAVSGARVVGGALATVGGLLRGGHDDDDED
jgi:membrane protein